MCFAWAQPAACARFARRGDRCTHVQIACTNAPARAAALDKHSVPPSMVLTHTVHGRPLPGALAMTNVSPATRLLEKRRQMFEVQEALEVQKQDFARKVRRVQRNV